MHSHNLHDDGHAFPVTAPSAFEAPLYFFCPDEKFAIEKPYGFKFPPSDPRIPRTNVEQSEYVCNILNMRGMEQRFSIAENGFTVFDLRSELNMSYEDFHDDERVKPYFKLLETTLKTHLQASEVKVFRSGVGMSHDQTAETVLTTRQLRKRHPAWPISEQTTYVHDQPTTVAHIDATFDEAAREIRLQEGDQAESLLTRRFQWFNFWKPLRGPLNDWPLLLCDAGTVDKELDITASDLIYPDHAAENMQVYHRSHYKWYYLGDQKTSEVLVFKQADSLPGSCAGVPHCSAYNPLASQEEPPRESIEVRALVYYDK